MSQHHPLLPVILATRPSRLARWQTQQVQQALARAFPERSFQVSIYTTEGDRRLDRPLPEIGGKGLFTQELEAALRSGDVDMAVHSLKDLPLESPPGLVLAAVLLRADPRDALISREGQTLAELPAGAVVGSSSPRRRAQLLALRPDLEVRSLRGNVETRVAKVQRGDYDAALLAAAGLERIGLEAHIAERLPLSAMLPAPGQGALAVQCRAGDEAVISMLRALEQREVRLAVEAERAFLGGLGGGCSAPVGAHAEVVDGQCTLQAVVAAPDGSRIIRVSGQGDDPAALGRRLARQALELGAEEYVPHE